MYFAQGADYSIECHLLGRGKPLHAPKYSSQWLSEKFAETLALERKKDEKTGHLDYARRDDRGCGQQVFHVAGKSHQMTEGPACR
jgi:hypothetical protein